jgi:hypothetical protein
MVSFLEAKENSPVELYRFENLDDDLNAAAQKPCTLETAIQTYEQCYENGVKKYDSSQDALAASSFVLIESERDYLEISCRGLDAIEAITDRIATPFRISGLFKKRSVLDKSQGYEIICDYFALERQAFESKYESFLGS